MKSYGFNYNKELRDQSKEDWVLGAKPLPDLADIPQDKREEHLPKGEIQRSNFDDMQDCVARGFNNKLELKLNYLYKEEIISPENREWLHDNGYITENGVELSDAYNAILSNTTRQGNSLKAPVETLRKHGAIPKKLLPLEQNMRFNDYHNSDRITPKLKKLGQEFLKRFPINYEKVYGLDMAKYMTVSGGYAWPHRVGEIYQRTENRFNHAFLVYRGEYFIFDNYIENAGDFIKHLAPNYKFTPYGYRIVINEKVITKKKPCWIRDIFTRMIR